MPNAIGTLYTLTTFGESHGAAIGGIVDGMPSGIDIDLDFIQNELNRRRPGQSKITTDRKETDEVELLSGVFEGKSTGTPIGFIVRNKNQQTKDYDDIRNLFRPSHADYTYYKKYGIRDYRGGGRASARITLARVVAGALAKLVLRKHNISIQAYTSQVGNIAVDKNYRKYNLSKAENNAVRCPDEAKAKEMESLIAEVKSEGALLGAAMLSINAAKGFEYGEGFDGSTWRGSQQNDSFATAAENENDDIAIRTNHSGGIQGGISNGEDIYFRVAFKPVATLLMEQKTVDIAGNEQTIDPRGRHDPCVLPRAVPIVESMAAMTILDALLVYNSKRM